MGNAETGCSAAVRVHESTCTCTCTHRDHEHLGIALDHGLGVLLREHAWRHPRVNTQAETMLDYVLNDVGRFAYTARMNKDALHTQH